MSIKLLLSIFGVPGFIIWFMYWIRWQGFVSEPVNTYTYGGAFALTALIWFLIFIFWDASDQRAEWDQWNLYYRLQDEKARRLLRRRANREVRNMKKAERKRRKENRKRNT